MVVIWATATFSEGVAVFVRWAADCSIQSNPSLSYHCACCFLLRKAFVLRAEAPEQRSLDFKCVEMHIWVVRFTFDSFKMSDMRYRNCLLWSQVSCAPSPFALSEAPKSLGRLQVQWRCLHGMENRRYAGEDCCGMSAQKGTLCVRFTQIPHLPKSRGVDG